ncbi:MAG TPA: polysaccharide biosynthesis/export family protein [Bacteroidia bacterium]|nr:polysaccharide biosynthesis/export family protein [Bacteroidia bacterium]
MKKSLLTRLAIFIVPGILLFLNSCNVLNPNIMLYADKHYQFDTLSKDTTVAKEFVLGPNDIIEFRLFANDGFKLIDIISTQNGNGGATANSMIRQGFEYYLDGRGIVRLPIIGEENLTGMGIREAENFLEKRYSEFYVKPFVLLKVINKRITVFPGEPGQAKVISLVNNNTTVIEALAQAGGISADGKAYNIKLIRQTNDAKHPYKVYKLDLSKIQSGLTQGSTIVQSNDIIYVEPRRQIASKALRELTPVLSLTTTLITFFYLIQRIP